MRLGIILSQGGNHEEAATTVRRARELDPLFALMFAVSANIAIRAGDPESALEFARQAIAINPQFRSGYENLGYAQFLLGNYEAALDAYAEAERLPGGGAGPATARVQVLVRIGRQDEAREILATLENQASNRYVAPYHFALIHAALEDFDQAFEWLQRALDARDINLAFLPSEPEFEPLLSDPRFASFMLRREHAIKADGSR